MLLAPLSGMANSLLRSASLGAIAGMRSMVAPTQVACSKQAAFKRALVIAATAELIADKFPKAPPRIQLPSLAWRAASGAISAASARDKEEAITAPLLVGAGSAIAASYAAYELRRWVGKRLGLRDAWVGLMEDAIVMGAGALLFRNSQKPSLLKKAA